jgi:hypothetical protein
MTPFEYVIVLISIILGLGITTILTGVAELIKHTSPVRLYAPYIIWILLVFVLHIQDWWVSYELKTIQVWELQFFLLIILYPINLYILAHLLFPAGLSKEFDSKVFYLDHFPRLFYGSIMLIILSTIQNIGFSGLTFESQIPKLFVVAALLVVAVFKFRSNILHFFLALMFLAGLIIGLAIDKENLVIQ